MQRGAILERRRVLRGGEWVEQQPDDLDLRHLHWGAEGVVIEGPQRESEALAVVEGRPHSCVVWCGRHDLRVADRARLRAHLRGLEEERQLQLHRHDPRLQDDLRGQQRPHLIRALRVRRRREQARPWLHRQLDLLHAEQQDPLRRRQ